MSKYRESILKTLSYSSIFSCSMSFNQLCTFLVTPKDKKIKYLLVKEDLKKLIKKSIVKTQSKKYSLTAFKTNNWQERHNNATNLLKQNKRSIQLLKSIPWINLLAITGSVAAYNAEENDDIDIFIVTKKNRMWLTRGFVWVFLKIQNKYAHFGDNHNKFCPNIFMDESSMKWPQNKQNFYVAHEISLMQPIISRNNTYFKFIKENEWIFEYLPHFVVHTKEFKKSKHKENFIVDKLEIIAEKLQRKYMGKKVTTEIVHKNFIHFNKKDSTQSIMDSYSEKTKNIRNQP